MLYYVDEVQQKMQILQQKTLKWSRMLPLYPPTGGPYSTLLYFRHSFQGIDPRSRPVKAVEVILVHLHGPRSDSYPMGKHWHFLR